MKVKIKHFFFTTVFFSWLLPALLSGQSLTLQRSLLAGRYEEALTEACRLLAADSSDASLWFLSGQAHLALLQYDEAEHDLLQAQRHAPDSVPVLLALGRTAALQGHDADAIRWYEEVLQHDPHHTVARTGLARACYNYHLFSQAIGNYEILVKKDPFSYAFQKELGQAYYAADSLKQAAAHFHSAVNLNKEDLNLANKLARLYLKLKEYTLASYIAAIGLSTDSTWIPLLETRAFALYRNKSYKLAAESFEACLRAGDNSLFVLKHLGYIYLSQDKFDEAIRMLEAAWKKDPALPETAYYLGLTYENLEQYDTAAYWLEKALVLYHPPAQLMAAIYRQLANNYYIVHRWIKAFDSYGEALKLDPKNPDVLFRMAEICDYHTNEKKKAIYYYQRVVDMSDINPATWDAEKTTTIPLAVAAWQRINSIREEMHFKGERME